MTFPKIMKFVAIRYVGAMISVVTLSPCRQRRLQVMG